MTFDDLMRELDTEETQSRLTAIDQVKLYDTERYNEATSKAAKDGAGAVLRNWFLTHPDEQELVNSDWGLRAFIQRGGTTRNYEHPSVIKADNPKLYARIEALGLLRLDDDAVEKALKEGLLTHGDLSGYVHEGERTPSLQVKAIR